MTQPLLVRDATVLHPERADIVPGCQITILDGEITAVEPTTTRDPGPDIQVVDVAGRVVMPGLIDAHVHVIAPTTNLGEIPSIHPALLVAHAKVALEAMSRRGFTAVRDAGGADFGIAEAVRRGYFTGPRMFVSGRALAQTGGQGDFRARYARQSVPSPAPYHITEVVDGVDDMLRAVREQFRQGADQIKLMAGGGISGGVPVGQSHFTVDELRAAVDEAAARGSYVMAHAYAPETIRRCVDAGVRTIEHGNLIDAETARAIAGRAYMVPTLAVYDAYLRHADELGVSTATRAELARLLDAGLASLAVCAEAGVEVGYGTDLEGILQPYQLEEFRLRARVSSPAEVIRSATTVNARILGQPGRIGVVAPGAVADLLVLDGNPLDDLEVLATGDHVAAVIQAGRLLHDRGVL